MEIGIGSVLYKALCENDVLKTLYSMWGCDTTARQTILWRFAVENETLK